MYRYFVESPLTPLIATIIGLNAITHSVKYGLRQLGLRDHWLVDRALPVIPVVLGAIGGALWGEYIGIALVVKGETVPTYLGAVHGAVLGMISGHAYKLALAWLPEKAADALRQKVPESRGAKGGS